MLFKCTNESSSSQQIWTKIAKGEDCGVGQYAGIETKTLQGGCFMFCWKWNIIYEFWLNYIHYTHKHTHRRSILNFLHKAYSNLSKFIILNLNDWNIPLWMPKKTLFKKQQLSLFGISNCQKCICYKSVKITKKLGCWHSQVYIYI